MIDTTNIVDYNRMIRAERRRTGPAATMITASIWRRARAGTYVATWS